MTPNIKKLVVTLFLLVCAVTVNAVDVCNVQPGAINCGKGAVTSLTGNGMVSMNGTQALGITRVNGHLSAENVNFSMLKVNGSSNLIECTVRSDLEIKGSLVASSTRFESNICVFSSSITFKKSNIQGNIHFLHTAPIRQVVYLDKFSNISGDVIFDDGEGEVIIESGAKIVGQVIGGRIKISQHLS